MNNDTILSLAAEIIELGRNSNQKIAIAESCTGGMIAAYITAIPGSSAVLDRGFVTYSYESKVDLLQVPQEMLESSGAVSAQVAAAMVSGTLRNSLADVAVSVTGIAGPGGGTPDKPVGLVYMGKARRDGDLAHTKYIFSGDRQSVRLQTVASAMRTILELLAAKR